MAAYSSYSDVPPGFKEVKSRRGRLYYAPIPFPALPRSPSGLLRTRVPRPHLLRISSVPPEYFGVCELKNTSPNSRRAIKLAYSRESAKRLLRFVTSSTPPTPNPPDHTNYQPARARVSSAFTTLPSQHPEEMAAVEGRWRGNSVGGPISGMMHRPSLSDAVRTASNTSNASTGNNGSTPFCASNLAEAKPLACANGISLSINLAEPMLFLQGFDQSELGNRTTTMLRGSLHMKVSKSAKIKTISLDFRGRAETEWPEGS